MSVITSQVELARDFAEQAIYVCMRPGPGSVNPSPLKDARAQRLAELWTIQAVSTLSAAELKEAAKLQAELA